MHALRYVKIIQRSFVPPVETLHCCEHPLPFPLLRLRKMLQKCKHLKKNFQYKVRGSKYSIPAPKPGSAKTGPGEGLVLREDQADYLRAKKKVDSKRQREDTKLMKNILSKGVDSNASVSSWMDPDWIPEMISTGSGGKGRTMKSSGMDGDLPQIGYGKKNPNESRRRK